MQYFCGLYLIYLVNKNKIMQKKIFYNPVEAVQNWP